MSLYWLIPSIVLTCLMWAVMLFPLFVQLAGGIDNLLDLMFTIAMINAYIIGGLFTIIITFRIISWWQDKKDALEYNRKQQLVKSVE